VKIRRGGYFSIRQSKNPRKSPSRGLYEAPESDPKAKKQGGSKSGFQGAAWGGCFLLAARLVSGAPYTKNCRGLNGGDPRVAWGGAVYAAGFLFVLNLHALACA